MRRRIGLLTNLAWAIGNLLNGSRITYANVRRYVTRDQLTTFRIRTDTEIQTKEWLQAMFIALKERMDRQLDQVRNPFLPPTRARMKRVFERMLETNSELLHPALER